MKAPPIIHAFRLGFSATVLLAATSAVLAGDDILLWAPAAVAGAVLTARAWTRLHARARRPGARP